MFNDKEKQDFKSQETRPVDELASGTFSKIKRSYTLVSKKELKHGGELSFWLS